MTTSRSSPAVALDEVGAAPRGRPQRAAVLAVAVMVATLARVGVGGAAPASSPAAALVFSVVLLSAVAWARGWVVPMHWSGLGVGVAGGATLIGLSLLGLPAVLLGARAPASVLVWWAPLVTLVAAAEELVLRGVLFDAVRRIGGDASAVAVTAVLFAVIHVPLYGLRALGLDLCVGLFLGCLRVATGGVTAPLVCHVLADLATGWLG